MQILNRSDASKASEIDQIRDYARGAIEACIGGAQGRVLPALPAQVAVYAEKEAQARAVIDLGVAAHVDDPDLRFVADEVELRGGAMVDAAQRILSAAQSDRDRLRSIEWVRLKANTMADSAETTNEAEAAIAWCKTEIAGG